MSKTTGAEYMISLQDMKVGKTYKGKYVQSPFRVLYTDDKKVVVEFLSSSRVDSFNKGVPAQLYSEVKPKRKATLRVVTNGVNIWSYLSIRGAYKGVHTVLYEDVVEIEGNLRLSKSSR